MTQEQIEKILTQLSDHENRLLKLEATKNLPITTSATTGNKQKTLREVVRGKKFSNGCEKIAAIVGYHEKILGSLVNKNNLKQAWDDAKLDGVYKTNILDDAAGQYVRVKSSGECDLTQTGEEFFDKLLNNESINQTSK